MDFQFTPEQKEFRNELLAFLKQELPPDWEGMDTEGSTDEEWAFVCRAGTTSTYGFGEPLELLTTKM